MLNNLIADHGQVYFDHLVEPLPNQSSNQVAPPSHVTATNEPNPEENSDVYFDHLVIGQPPTPSKKGQKPLPQQPQEEDNVYFDHLVGKYQMGVRVYQSIQ